MCSFNSVVGGVSQRVVFPGSILHFGGHSYYFCVATAVHVAGGSLPYGDERESRSFFSCLSNGAFGAWDVAVGAGGETVAAKLDSFLQPTTVVMVK